MNPRPTLSYVLFYLRLLPLLAIRLVAKVASLFGKVAQRAIERVALPPCNHLFRPVFDPARFMTVESFSEGQDVSDFFTLCRRTGIDDGWFRGCRILDAGCGSGLFALAAAAIEAAEVVGIDIDEPRIPYARKAAAQRGMENTRFMVMSLYDMAFEDSSFDRVICHTVFEHLPDLPGALAQLHRVLKPGGEAFITHDSFRSRYGAHVAHFVNIPWPCAFFSEEAVVDFWKKCHTRYVTSNAIPAEAVELDLLGGGIHSLNELRISDVERMVRNSPFEIMSMIPYGEEKALLSSMPWLKKWPALHEYLRGSLALRLRRHK